MSLFYGIINPKGHPDDKDTTQPRESELKKFVDEVASGNVRIPCYEDHQTGRQGKLAFGEVKGATVLPDGRVRVAFKAYDTEAGRKAKEEIESGRKRHLSLGYDVAISEHPEWGTQKAHGAFPHEVSICAQGAREGTFIEGYIVVNDDGFSADRNLAPMSTTPDQTSNPSPEEVAKLQAELTEMRRLVAERNQMDMERIKKEQEGVPEYLHKIAERDQSLAPHVDTLAMLSQQLSQSPNPQSMALSKFMQSVTAMASVDAQKFEEMYQKEREWEARLEEEKKARLAAEEKLKEIPAIQSADQRALLSVGASRKRAHDGDNEILLQQTRDFLKGFAPATNMSNENWKEMQQGRVGVFQRYNAPQGPYAV